MIYVSSGVVAAFMVWIVLGVCRYAYNRSTGKRLPMKRDVFLTIGAVAWAAYTSKFVFTDLGALTPAYSAESLGFFTVWLIAGWACYRRDGGLPEWQKYPGLKLDE
ncbi:hypothetical protein ACFWGD_01565 [Corynebacterium sp. NPDC060344]|uniref:hypothetical protein n=1 Tax=Corynebacterium sp. NPDC060344 TaxID=3347101 RepID=UPI003657222C